jgi:Fe2+ or Zn2+ uptake regulation protein
MNVDYPSVLREHGLQVTAQRLAVMRAVAKAPHSTADDIAATVRGDLGAISRQAVYDVLGVLVARNLIRRIQPAGSAALYEDRVGDDHHHVICRVCGRTADVECPTEAAPCPTQADAGGFRVDTAEIIYWGICPECLPSTPVREAPVRPRQPRDA